MLTMWVGVGVQERGCYVFAFAGPQEVRELELGTDMASVNNLLGFLEKVRTRLAAPATELLIAVSRTPSVSYAAGGLDPHCTPATFGIWDLDTPVLNICACGAAVKWSTAFDTVD